MYVRTHMYASKYVMQKTPPPEPPANYRGALEAPNRLSSTLWVELSVCLLGAAAPCVCWRLSDLFYLQRGGFLRGAAAALC